MPFAPFILHTHVEHHPNEFRRQQTLHTPNRRYLTPYIKTTDWECFPLSQPIDHDPYCPKEYSLHTSHYDRLGIETEEDWSTSTGDMSKELLAKKKKELTVNPDKSLVNVFSDFQPKDPPVECGQKGCTEFLSTMKYHYQNHFPESVKKEVKHEVPFLRDRKLACIPGKFLDDNDFEHLKRIQCLKMHRHISYNPLTGVYTNEKKFEKQDRTKPYDYREYIKNYIIT